ncbi:hypothetical protein AB4Y45_33655 [Paraburkholderia sp. EG287A]|uniref:hypothetical protein n=1 Tax=Paraburkholderia sp. EG287A TaxID=3237012 RepID=UPI0034D377DD
MPTTMHENVVNGRLVFWQTSCRTEGDWYAITYGGSIIADHLPTKEAAEEAGAAAIAHARATGASLPA